MERLALDIRDRLRSQVSDFGSRVKVAESVGTIELQLVSPYAWVLPREETEEPLSTGELRFTARPAILVVAQYEYKGKSTVGVATRKGIWELARSVKTALRNHYFAPASGDRSGPWTWAANGEDGLLVSSIEGLGDEDLARSIHRHGILIEPTYIREEAP